MVVEYLRDVYGPAEDALLRREAGGGALGRALAERERRLAAHGEAVRWSRLDATPWDAGWEIAAEVYLDGLPLEDVEIELYAEAAFAGGAPVRIPMLDAGPLPGTTNGRLFRASVPSSRPPSDYTPRLVPARRDAAVPLELPWISWAR
jgi:starch phosphorylase